MSGSNFVLNKYCNYTFPTNNNQNGGCNCLSGNSRSCPVHQNGGCGCSGEPSEPKDNSGSAAPNVFLSKKSIPLESEIDQNIIRRMQSYDSESTHTKNLTESPSDQFLKKLTKIHKNTQKGGRVLGSRRLQYIYNSGLDDYMERSKSFSDEAQDLHDKAIKSIMKIKKLSDTDEDKDAARVYKAILWEQAKNEYATHKKQGDDANLERSKILLELAEDEKRVKKITSAEFKDKEKRIKEHKKEKEERMLKSPPSDSDDENKTEKKKRGSKKERSPKSSSNSEANKKDTGHKKKSLYRKRSLK